MKNILLTIVFAISYFNCSFVLGQNKAPQNLVLHSATSPNGNYIYMYEKANNVFDSITYAATDYFEITRRAYNFNNNTKEFKRIGIAQPVQNEKELNDFYSKEEIASLKKIFNLNSNNDLINYFKQNSYPNSYKLSYLFTQTKLVLGHIFLDKNVASGEIYEYKIYRITNNKSKEEWGGCVVNSKAANKLLPLLKPKGEADYMSDSLVALSWHLPITKKYIDSLVKTVTDSADNNVSNISKKYDINFYAGTVYLKSDNGWISTSKLLPSINATHDTLTYIYTKKTVPDELVAAYLKMEDEVGNLGIESDTAFAFAVENKSLPLLMGITVKDIVDGIKISWKQLPPKPYINGVEILRYNSNDELDTIAVLGAWDSVYYDYEIKVGQPYRYQARAVYIPQLKLTQEVPAQGVGQYTKFSIPQPATHLKAVNEGKNVRLNWDFKDHQSFYAFYIYRGTSPDNISLIAGPIKTKTFLDTAGALSGRSHYTYGVITQNLRQDTSIFSNLITINPNRKIATTVPNDLSFYYTNGKLRISWKDARENDNAIESYIVQKGIKGSDRFTTLSALPLVVNTITDSVIEAGITYEYKVACITFKGDTSEFSDASQYILAKQDVELVNTFYVRNLKDGVEVSLPAMQYDNRKTYNIYRRTAKASSFTKVGSIPANTFVYEDKTAEKKSVYVYAITITEKDDREGIIGKSISIRKD